MQLSTMHTHGFKTACTVRPTPIQIYRFGNFIMVHSHSRTEDYQVRAAIECGARMKSNGRIKRLTMFREGKAVDVILTYTKMDSV